MPVSLISSITLSSSRPQRHPHQAPLGRVFNRVIDKVIEYLANRFLIRPDNGRALGGGRRDHFQTLFLPFRERPVLIQTFVHDGGQFQFFTRKRLRGGLDTGQTQQIENQVMQPCALIRYPLQELATMSVIVHRPVDQCLDAGLNNRQGRFELMRDVGDKLLPDTFQPAELGIVVKDQHGPVSRFRSRGGTAYGPVRP